MTISRRAFLRTVPAVVAAVSLPIAALPASATPAGATPVVAAEPLAGSSGLFTQPEVLLRPSGDPSFESYWVKTFLETKTWPSADELDAPTAAVSEGRLFRVDGPQDAYRLPVWNPRSNQQLYIGAEAVGPVESPFWADFAEDGRWMDVSLTPMQHIRAMQGEDEKFRDLVTAGLQGMTKPGLYRIMRRVYNETMDSRSDPTIQATYLVKNVLYTQYFYGNGSAIHYNWWGPPRGFGYPSSQGCLGMRLAGAKWLWEWADIDTPLVIHA